MRKPSKKTTRRPRADFRLWLRIVCVQTYICGEQLEVLDGMPDSSDPLPLDFFANLECPLTLAATEVTTVEVDQSEATKEPEESASGGNQS